ncbi:uncharacterized protein LOC121376754 [Gigantopelta aegis]|uniref:uncharacterized protein LOC121376754 n=1 Tax=Gigantopelta aegis TaxID=1735272 RepID=UPI001B889F78|nr:uncharacterized protein LOC121376754 [Gigantopelta aegis]
MCILKKGFTLYKKDYNRMFLVLEVSDKVWVEKLKTDCNMVGARMVVLDLSWKNDLYREAIINYTADSGHEPMNAIIGAKFNETSGRAYWFDSDSPFEYNDLVSDATPGDNNTCVAMKHATQYRWEYVPCSGFAGVVACEIPPKT